jgi:DNA-directed RNA polymerase specialized sigma24 family protein
MSVRLPSRSTGQIADDILTANYEPLKPEILRTVDGTLRGQGVKLNSHDLDAAYNAGWHGVVQHIKADRPVTSLEGLLYRITLRRALDIYRAKQDRRRVDLDLSQEGVEVDLAKQLDDEALLARLLSRLKDRLNEKELRGVTLCVLHGYKRPEAADRLGIDRVVFERVMDGAMKKMAGVVAGIAARGCGDDEWSRLMCAYALGALDESEPDYRRAKEHIDGTEGCEACRRYVRGLRGLSVVLPPLLPFGLPAGYVAGILAYLRRVFGGGHGPAAGRAALHTQAPAAGSAGAAGAAGGSGPLAAALSGTAGKAAIVVGALALATGGAVIATHHTHPSSPPAKAATTQHFAAALQVPVAHPAVATHRLVVVHHRQRARGGSLPATGSQRALARAARGREQPPEFGFETPAESGSVPSTAAAASAAPAHAAPAPQPAAHSEGSGEFSFEAGH